MKAFYMKKKRANIKLVFVSACGLEMVVKTVQPNNKKKTLFFHLCYKL